MSMKLFLVAVAVLALAAFLGLSSFHLSQSLPPGTGLPVTGAFTEDNAIATLESELGEGGEEGLEEFLLLGQ